MSLTMSNCPHGPFKSGKVHWSLIEAAEHLSSTMDEAQFNTLFDCMCEDLRAAMGTGQDDQDQQIQIWINEGLLPASKAEIPTLKALVNYPSFAACPYGGLFGISFGKVFPV